MQHYWSSRCTQVCMVRFENHIFLFKGRHQQSLSSPAQKMCFAKSTFQPCKRKAVRRRHSSLVPSFSVYYMIFRNSNLGRWLITTISSISDCCQQVLLRASMTVLSSLHHYQRDLTHPSHPRCQQ